MEPRKEASMSTRTETETRPESTQAEERRGEGDGNLGLIHLAACLGAGGAAILAINLIEWLR
jgi:hypothetical protein